MPIYESTYTGDEIDENLGKAATALQSTDVVNDLTSTDTDKPLSAAQGKALQDNKAHLAGVTGGQTLIGGTAVDDKLTVQGTTGNGTATATAFEVKTGNDGALTALTVANNGQVGIGTSPPTAKLGIDASGANIAPISVKTNGSVGNYSPSNSGMFFYDASGEELFRIWASDPDVLNNYNSGNLYIGLKAGENQPTDNVSAGYRNTGIGPLALRSNTTGNDNTASGQGSLASNTTGSNNTASGQGSLASNTTGSNNTAVGRRALEAVTTGSNNTAVGVSAGAHHANGTNFLTAAANSVYIGSNARGLNNSDSNSVVIGGNTPIGLGANTTVLGTSATTLTRLYGNVATGTDTPSAAFHAVKTTEQLRLGYDASNYASFTVDASGNLTLNATGTTVFTGDVTLTTINGESVPTLAQLHAIALSF